jgi:hypothetical protein
MVKNCLWCKKDFKAQRETAKFCSTSHRVMYNHKFGTKVMRDWQSTNIYNQMVYINRKLVEQIEKMNWQPLPETSNYTKGIIETVKVKDYENIVEQPEFLKYSDYESKISKSKTIPEIEKIVAKAFKDPNITWPERYKLKQFGTDLSKEMYSD